MTYPLVPQKETDLQILGMPVHDMTDQSMKDYISNVIQEKKKALVFTINIHAANFGVHFPWYRDYYRKAQLVYCDSDGIRLGLKLLGQRVPVKIPLSRWIWDLAGLCEQKGFSMYLLGGRKGVPEKAAEELKYKYPKLRISGTRDNFFDKEGPENGTVIEEINRSKTDVLIVGFGMPSQETWIYKNYEKLNVSIFMPGGATVEFAAKNIKMAPSWMIRIHLEWLFRLCSEPKRLFKRYLYGIPFFFWHVLLQRLGVLKLKQTT